MAVISVSFLYETGDYEMRKREKVCNDDDHSIKGRWTPFGLSSLCYTQGVKYPWGRIITSYNKRSNELAARFLDWARNQDLAVQKVRVRKEGVFYPATVSTKNRGWSPDCRERGSEVKKSRTVSGFEGFTHFTDNRYDEGSLWPSCHFVK